MSTYETTSQEGTDAELTSFDGRPEACECWNADGDLPCFACYLEGFDVPNPAEPAADGDD